MLYVIQLSPGTYYARAEGSRIITTGRDNAMRMPRLEATVIQAHLKRTYPRVVVVRADAKETHGIQS
jgi:hypothetical protein